MGAPIARLAAFRGFFSWISIALLQGLAAAPSGPAFFPLNCRLQNFKSRPLPKWSFPLHAAPPLPAPPGGGHCPSPVVSGICAFGIAVMTFFLSYGNPFPPPLPPDWGPPCPLPPVLVKKKTQQRKV